MNDIAFFVPCQIPDFLIVDTTDNINANTGTTFGPEYLGDSELFDCDGNLLNGDSFSEYELDDDAESLVENSSLVEVYSDLDNGSDVRNVRRNTGTVAEIRGLGLTCIGDSLLGPFRIVGFLPVNIGTIFATGSSHRFG